MGDGLKGLKAVAAGADHASVGLEWREVERVKEERNGGFVANVD